MALSGNATSSRNFSSTGVRVPRMPVPVLGGVPVDPWMNRDRASDIHGTAESPC